MPNARFCLLLLLAAIGAEAATPRKLADYREIERTYRNLAAADLSGCRGSFRFINRNWMDCTLHLPSPGIDSPLKQIFPAYFPHPSYDLPTGVPGVTLSLTIATSTHSFDEASLGTRLWITAYYRKQGDPRIQSLPESEYAYPVLERFLRDGLHRLDAEGQYSSRVIAAIDPQHPSHLTHDRIVGSVYLAAQAIEPDLAACRAAYRHDYEDVTGSHTVWSSGCSVGGSRRQFLPLAHHWSPALKALVADAPVEAGLGDLVARLSYSAGHYGVSVGVRTASGGVSYDVDVPYQRAESVLRALFAKARGFRRTFSLSSRSWRSSSRGRGRSES